MRKWLVPALACVVILSVAGAWMAVDRLDRRRLEQARFEGGETEVKIANLAGSPLAFFRATDTIDDAQSVPLPEGGIWLPEGNYFLESRAETFRLLYPVPLMGYRLGPDADHSFPLTVRALGFGLPPTLDENLSRFVFVPSGYFLMGDRRSPGQRHYVWLTGFFLSAFEVSNAEFRRFLQDPEGYDDRRNWTEAGWRWRSSAPSNATARLEPSHPEYRRFGRDDLPVVLVNWYEANAYGHWLTRRLGQGKWLFRMLTEAEWEKAARGPDNLDYGLGMKLSEPEARLYNWRKNPGAEVTVVGIRETLGIYRPNRFGVYHASGNVAEWTQSVMRPYNWENPYQEDDRNYDSTPGTRASRGGSWYSATTARLYLAYRDEFQPEMASNDIGFRIAAVPLPIHMPPTAQTRP